MNSETMEIRYNVMRVTSIRGFARVKGGAGENSRDVYFVRMIGVGDSYADEIREMDRLLSAESAAGRGAYSRISSFPRIVDPQEIEEYRKRFDDWRSSGCREVRTKRIGKERPELARRAAGACRETAELYRSIHSGASEHMERNFIIKLLYWLDEAAGGLLENWRPQGAMKFAAENVEKEQEYLFCFFLTRLGADVLLLQNERDIGEPLAALRLSEACRLGERRPFAIEEYRPEKYAGKSAAEPERVSTATSRGLPEAGVSGVDAGGAEALSGISGNAGSAHSAAAAGVVSANNAVSAAGAAGANNTASAANRTDGAGTMGTAAVAGIAGVFGGRSEGSATGAPSGKISWTSIRRPDRDAAGVPGRSAGGLGEKGAEKSFEELALLASSVVMISVHNAQGEIAATGSGIMIGRDGYILTNNHVIANGGAFYSVRIENDENVYTTDEIVKYNAVLDLAIIRIDRTLSPLAVYPGGKELVRGQKVVAIGSPLGMFNSVSDGIISGFRSFDDVAMIQFTAPVSHGSSGGALLNMMGEVIGIITAGIDQGQNINLAVGYEFIGTFTRGFR